MKYYSSLNSSFNLVCVMRLVELFIALIDFSIVAVVNLKTVSIQSVTVCVVMISLKSPRDLSLSIYEINNHLFIYFLLSTITLWRLTEAMIVRTTLKLVW